MRYMFEVYYPAPANDKKETFLADQMRELGGRLDYREESNHAGRGTVCLTFEFADIDSANRAAERLRAQGEHIEGPMDYAS
jgi:hypothetical protein